MTWQVYKDNHLTITGTSNGYYTITVQDDLEESAVCFDVTDASYLQQIGIKFLEAAILLKNDLQRRKDYAI